MISFNTINIITRLPGNQVLVQKNKHSDNLNELSDEERRLVQELKNRDQEVRAHEAKHMRRLDVFPIGGPHYTYTIGPDGKLYAVGGKVMIATGAINDPESGLRKAQVLKDVALAPGEPSSQDLATAGAAQAMEMEAMAQIAQEDKQKDKGVNDSIASWPSNAFQTAIDTYKEIGTLNNSGINLYQLSNTPDEDNHINLIA